MQIKTGPFLRTPLTIEQIMLDVLISLLPATIAGVVFFGFPALVVLGLSTLTAVVTEALLLRSPLTPRGIFGDGSAAVTGLLVGLILPPTTAWWIPVLGSFLAIALVKWAFGGIGYNIFNPALGARAILLLAFTSQMVKFTVPFDTITAATPLLTSRSFSWSLVWGNVGGSIGETSVIAILLGALYLLYKQHINWRIPVGYVGSAFVLALLWGLDPWFTITAGGLLFAAVFMATDMVTSPVTPTGQLIFGIGCGVLTLVIRQYTPFPEGVTFAVLTMNALAPAIESLTIPTCFGVGLSRETRYKGVAVGVASLLVVVGIFVALERFQPAVTPIISYGQHLPIAEFLGTDDYEVVEQGGIRYYLTYDEDENPQTVAFIGEQGGFNGPIRFLLVLDENQQITEVQILEHREDPGLGELITRSAFLDQFKGLDRDSAFALGTDIQAVSGATISSRSFTTGVRRALENFDATFYPQEEVGAWVDGTFAGKADSFGGPLEVEVTVSGGKISAVQVLKHSDTPGISDGAIKNVPERIVAANSFQVDAFSGATVT
ncbi:MAG: RnfABCDGE type electron transport complex subunit D, partial [Firmicutes bacterium]|nr:RnfABCDGE type electron transport complex subunit D [Bacillota bacterium]